MKNGEGKQFLGKNKLIRGCLVFLFFILFQCVLAESSLHRTIRIGIVEGYPFAFTDKDGSFKGFYVDLFLAISRAEQWQYEIIKGPPAYLLQLLQEKKLDVAVGIEYTPERERWLDYSSVVLLSGWCQLYSARENFQSLSALAEKNTGVIAGDMASEKLKSVLSSLSIHVPVKEYLSAEGVFRALAKKEIEALVINNLYGYAFEKRFKAIRTNVVFEPYGYYVVTPPGRNEKILQTIDLYLRRWKAESSSPYHQSFRRWILQETKGSSAKNVLPYVIYVLFFLAFFIVLVFAIRQNRRLKKRNKELKDMQQKLSEALARAEASDKLKLTFINNITHHLRTPANGIMGFAQLLYDSPKTSEEQKMFLDVIIYNTARLVEIINDLIDISKIESGEMELNPGSFIVGEMIEEIVQQARETLKKEKREHLVSIHVLPDPHVTSVVADRMRVKQVLHNLVSNALKFTPKGQITLGYKLFRSQQYLEFFVKDTGIGIPEDKQENIFDRFRHGDEAYSQTFEGTGLGLAIARGIAELMNGRIMVNSTLNKGSVFYFSIPFQEGITASPAPTPIKTSPCWQKQKILIVENERSSYLYLHAVLSRTGANILHARNACHAIELVRKHSDITAVLTEVILPDMNGIELIRQLKKSNPALLIIVQTPYPLAGEKEECIKSGASEYLVKPLTVKTLLECMEKLFHS